MDRIIRGHFTEQNIRFALCQTAGLCSEAVRRHRTDWIAGWLLSEALTCAALLSVNLKQKEKYTLRWNYPGPVGTILADTNPDAEVRGFPQQLRPMSRVSTLAEALQGAGVISAITSLPNRVVHTGIARGELVDVPRDMAQLFSTSFQVPTLITVGLIVPPRDPLTVRSAIGVLIQPMPRPREGALADIRGIAESDAFRSWLESESHALEKVLERLTPDGARCEVLAETQPRFFCACSKQKVESVLRMFEPAELREMLEREGKAEVNCHFCATYYSFSKSEIETMLGQSQSGHA